MVVGDAVLMAGDFAARITQLQEAVGTGPLEIKVQFDQPYAVVMETGHWINYRGWGSPPEGEGEKTIEHFHGGGSHFLRNGLYGTFTQACQRMADHVLDGDPGSLIRAAADGGEAICTAASAGAPIEFGDLRESDHLQVFDDGALVFDRPAPVGPLSSSELAAKAATKSPRTGGDGKRHYLPASSSRHGLAHPYNGGPPLDKPAPTVDGRSERSHDESWTATLGNWQTRRVQYRIPDLKTDKQGLRRNRSYDEDESWGGTTPAEDARAVSDWRSRSTGTRRTPEEYRRARRAQDDEVNRLVDEEFGPAGQRTRHTRRRSEIDDGPEVF
jgi:hypothetical protein